MTLGTVSLSEQNSSREQFFDNGLGSAERDRLRRFTNDHAQIDPAWLRVHQHMNSTLLSLRGHSNASFGPSLALGEQFVKR